MLERFAALYKFKAPLVKFYDPVYELQLQGLEGDGFNLRYRAAVFDALFQDYMMILDCLK